MRKNLIAHSLIVFFLILACTDEPQKDISEKTVNKVFKEPLVDANINSVKEESDQIEAYIQRRKWSVERSGTGLRYLIYEHGSGGSPKERDWAVVEYEVSLINGTVCYKSQKGKPEKFMVEMDEVESGLHEGIQKMKIGDRAKLIIPSHLAHGLLGDLNKIPPKSTVIYDIKLVGIQ